MMTIEDIKRIKELDNSLSIALEVNDRYQRENKELSERVKLLENNRSLDTMDEVAYRELEGKNRANIKEIDRLSEENSNLRLIKKL